MTDLQAVLARSFLSLSGPKSVSNLGGHNGRGAKDHTQLSYSVTAPETGYAGSAERPVQPASEQHVQRLNVGRSGLQFC